MLARMMMLMLTVVSLINPLQAGWFDTITGGFFGKSSEPPPTIKILIVHDKPGVVLEVKGKYKIFDPHAGKLISSRFMGKRKFIQAIADGIKWGEEFPGIHQLVIKPDEKQTTTIVDGIEYHGLIYVYDVGGTISVVNEIKLEDYLSSILAFRFRSPLTEETLAAVAIAARTTAYYQIESSKTPYWAVDARQVGFQGYAAINTTNPIEKALQATRYMVMTSPASSREVHPFIAEWREMGPTSEDAVVSQISLAEAEEMAKKGEHAAQILFKAFPGTRIELIHYEGEG